MFLNSTINLLPNDKKKHLERLVKYIFVRDILEIIILMYAVLGIILLWSYNVLQEEFNNLAESAASVSREQSIQNQGIKQINNLIQATRLSSQNYIPVSPKLNELIANLPADIKLNAINLNRTQNTLTLSGTATTRDALLNYQKILRDMARVNKVNAPTSQLFQKDNINFEIKVELKNQAS